MDTVPKSLRLWFVAQYPALRLPASYLVLAIFALFNVLWAYWLRRLNHA